MENSTIKPSSIYVVDLLKTVPFGRGVIHAGKATRLRGDVLKGLKEAHKNAVGEHSEYAPLHRI